MQPYIGREPINTWWMMRMLRISNGSKFSSNITRFVQIMLWYGVSAVFNDTDFTFFFHSITCSKYDLYSKSKVRIDVEKVKPYYLSLVEKVVSPFLPIEKFKKSFLFSFKFLLMHFSLLQYFPAKLNWWNIGVLKLRDYLAW